MPVSTTATVAAIGLPLLVVASAGDEATATGFEAAAAFASVEAAFAGAAALGAEAGGAEAGAADC